MELATLDESLHDRRRERRVQRRREVEALHRDGRVQALATPAIDHAEGALADELFDAELPVEDVAHEVERIRRTRVVARTSRRIRRRRDVAGT